MGNTNPETIIKNGILRDLWAHAIGFFWNNPTGVAVPLDSAKRGQTSPMIKYGLPGSPDIIGVTPVTVTAEMVGSVVGIATGIEVKTATGRQSEQQKKFQKEWELRGGRYIVARSFADVVGADTVGTGGQE